MRSSKRICSALASNLPKKRRRLRSSLLNKGEQFEASQLLSRTQHQRERAFDLAKQLALESALKDLSGKGPSEDLPSAGNPPASSTTCGICWESPAAFEIICKKHSFCASCVAKHISTRTDQNLAAYCPGQKCGHELLQAEVDAACSLAGKQAIARLYQERTTLRRTEPKKAKVACANRCGNLTCSKIDDERHASFEACEFVSCVKCNSCAHPDEPDCITYLEKALYLSKDNAPAC